MIDQAHKKTTASDPAIGSSDNNQIINKIQHTSLHSPPINITNNNADLATLIAQEQNNLTKRN
jgi:hypothetical protein